MKLVFSPAAIADLEAISDYTYAAWGPEQETRYLKGLWLMLNSIQKMPESFRFRTDLGINCRSARYQKHLIFFSSKADTTEIIRILHHAMDFQSHLEEGLG